MVFDEKEWIKRYVVAGGEEADARAIFAKMLEAQTSNSGPNGTRRKSPLQGKFSPNTATELVASQLPGLSSVAISENLVAAPESIEPISTEEVAGDATITPPPEHDLFGELPPKAPPARKRIAALPTAIKPGRKPASFDSKDRTKTQKELDLFHLSLEIEEINAKQSGDLGFLATAMIYASLPHSEVEGGVFKRRNGSIALTILNDPDIGLPYGKIPRIMTAFLCTEAKRHKDTRGREIHLGTSQAEFMSKLGMHSTGGERGDIGRVREQAKKLFTSTITLTGDPGSHFHWKKVNIADEGMLLWNPQDVREKSPWQSKLILGQKFYDECIEHSVPIDLRVLQKLRSPLAIDIYIWLTYRYNSITVPTHVTWRQLQWQFGSNYPNTPQGERDFKVNFKKQLRNVIAVYPDAKMDVRQDLLLLLPSRPHILPDAS